MRRSNRFFANELKWNTDDADDFVVCCSLIVVRELEWHADYAD